MRELGLTIDKIIAGDVRTASRVISFAENEDARAAHILKALFAHTGRAKVIGITGAPGSGKSTLTDKLAKEMRRRDKKVGIVAVDPTSPFTGGAILGDRIRMSSLATDPGVFIRSMGTRGQLGGLAKNTMSAVRILDAFGCDYIFIETVGVGQSEVDIIKLADLVLIVNVPGLGDDIQAIKAGLMEIGDIMVVNKADKEGADRLVIELETMLDFRGEQEGLRPPVLRTIAQDGEGVPTLCDQIDIHFEHNQKIGLLEKRRRRNLRLEVENLLLDRFTRRMRQVITAADEMDNLTESLYNRETDPYTVAETLGESMKLP
jgi:LAO/AO transport system kinase